MKSAPLQLCRYFVTDIRCSAHPDFELDKPVQQSLDQLHVETEIRKIETDTPGQIHWSIRLSASYQALPEQNYPYGYSIELVGIFASPAKVPSGLDDERLVRINGCSMLYGVAREKLRTLTAAGPWGEILIPTISFFKPVKSSPREPKQNRKRKG